ncbi:MAG: phenylalanine--tRNA ligase beta subunit-related protein [Planctomycetota bacterium]|nr:phenylalanine--tRNA ligase beta subunit-related protein [Planctomycetota bacterium]
MTSFEVAPECHALGLRAGAILFRDLRIRPASVLLREAIDATAQDVQKTFADRRSIRSHPALQRIREILSTIGSDPRRHPPSTEKLLQYARTKLTLPAINNLVDCYNLISLQSFCSLGAHDLDRVSLPVRLQQFTVEETFIPLGSSEPQAIRCGEFGYVDQRVRILCRLDSLQADFSKVTTDTRNAILIVEATDATPPPVLAELLQSTANAVQKHCGGRVMQLVGPN